MFPANSARPEWPTPPTPTSDEAQSWQAAGLQEGQETTDSHDSAVSSADRKAWSTVQAPDEAHATQARAQRNEFERLRALLAMRGHELYSTAHGIFIVRRWGRERDLNDLASVEKFARQVGAA